MIDAVEMGPFLGDARVLRLPPPVDDIVSGYLELAHLEAPGLIQGLYLVGSVALDDFRPRTSDIDFVAVTGPPTRLIAGRPRRARPSAHRCSSKRAGAERR